MPSTKALEVKLTKLDYYGSGQGSADIGNDLEFEFIIQGSNTKVKPSSLLHATSENFDQQVFYRILDESELPYDIRISITAVEKDFLPMVDITDDTNLSPVITNKFIINNGDFERKYTKEVIVFEDSDPLKSRAVFNCHFKATLKAIEDLAVNEEIKPKPDNSINSVSSTSGSTITKGPIKSPVPNINRDPLLTTIQRCASKAKDLIAFVSDLHIGADHLVDDFDQSDDQSFATMIDFIQGLDAKSKELILLGDFLELWETQPIAPHNTTYERRVDVSKLKIVRIIREHPAVFNALKNFSENHSVTYIYGNHDDELLEPQLADHFKQVSGVKCGFAFDYENVPFEVFARHGHQYDSGNFTNDPIMKIPTGRWIVENFIVPLENITTNGNTSALGVVDSFTPSSKFGDYLRCIRKSKRISEDQLKEARDILTNLNSNVPLTGASSIAANVVDAIYDGLQFIKLKSPIDEFEELAWVAEFLKRDVNIDEDSYKGLLNGTDKSCILMGHTHEGFIKRVGTNKLIVNTGTWMNKLESNPRHPCYPNPMPTRHLTVLIKTVIEEPLTVSEILYPKDSVKVDVFQFSMRPGYANQLQHEEYFLEP